jgi:hypothetical protein
LLVLGTSVLLNVTPADSRRVNALKLTVVDIPLYQAERF